MFEVYVLKSEKAKKSYVESTNDIQRRLTEHNSGKCFYTKRYLPWRLIYEESFEDEGDARKRENYFKTSVGRRFLKKIFDCYSGIV